MPQGSIERRRQRRVNVEAPFWVRHASTEPPEPPTEHRTVNVGLAGLYFESHAQPYKVNDVVMASVFIPEPQRRVFPFTRLAGHGRVVRVDELQAGGDGRTRFGVALEFSSDLMALTSIPTRS